jgi:hypothetical protein
MERQRLRLWTPSRVLVDVQGSFLRKCPDDFSKRTPAHLALSVFNLEGLQVGDLPFSDEDH